MRVLGFIRKGSNITGAIRQAIAQARRTRRPGLP